MSTLPVPALLALEDGQETGIVMCAATVCGEFDGQPPSAEASSTNPASLGPTPLLPLDPPLLPPLDTPLLPELDPPLLLLSPVSGSSTTLPSLVLLQRAAAPTRRVIPTPCASSNKPW